MWFIRHFEQGKRASEIVWCIRKKLNQFSKVQDMQGFKPSWNTLTKVNEIWANILNQLKYNVSTAWSISKNKGKVLIHFHRND